MRNAISMSMAIVLVACSTKPLSAAGPPSFTGLGFLPGGINWSQGMAVSDDGNVVVGIAQTVNHPPPGSSTINRAFRWTSGGGMVDLGPLPGGSNTFANGVNGDGSVVVGHGGVAGPDQHAFRWTSAGGMIDIGTVAGDTNSFATAVSADGSVVVGHSGHAASDLRAFRWTSGNGMVSLGTIPGGTGSYVNAVSSDGAVVVGYGDTLDGDRAFRWDSATGMVALGTLPGGSSSKGTGVNCDGIVIVGYGDTSSGISRAFRWTSGGLENLGTIPGGTDSYSIAVNGDGSTVVGYADSIDGHRAFLWDSTNGMVNLNTYLPSLGVDLTDWTLEHAWGVSSDGQTIVGWGMHDGSTEAWVAVIPEPSTALLIGAGCVILLHRRRRRIA